MTKINIDELKQARYMSLSSPQASSEATRLVLHNIIDIILSKEQQKRAKQPIAAVNFKSVVRMIVDDLLVGLQTRKTGWLRWNDETRK